MRKNTIIAIAIAFALVVLVGLFGGKTGGPGGTASSTGPATAVSTASTPSTTSSAGPATAASTPSGTVVSYDSLYTLTPAGGKTVVGIRVNPRTVSLTFTTIIYDNGKKEFDYLTIRYRVSGGTTTEVVVTGGLLRTSTFTAIGVGKTAVIKSGSSVSTDSNWTPFVFRVFAAFSPYVVKGSTTYFTMGGDVLETTTLTVWGTNAVISHVYRVVVGGSTFEKTVLMTGVMRDFSTVLSLPVYSDFPSFSYPWISGGKTVLPVFLVSGIIEREHTFVGSGMMETGTEFYSVMGTSVPTSFVGYQAGVVTSASGTAAVVYYGSVALTGSLTGGGFVVTVSMITTSNKLSGSIPAKTTTVTDFMKRFYMFRTFLGASSIVVNGTPVLVASYYENRLTFVITYGRDFAVVRGVYKIVTDAKGGFAVLRTFAVYDMSIVGVTPVG